MSTLEGHSLAPALRQASLEGQLGDWTKHLTTVVVETCGSLDWQASAKGHPLKLLPKTGSEYLTIDVMAFPPGTIPWRFSVAVMELENSPDEARVAYALWKVLCVRVELRVVYCYRQSRADRAALLTFLEHHVLPALPREQLGSLEGETWLVIGTREDAHTFPYAFFKWFSLDRNTGRFRSA